MPSLRSTALLAILLIVSVQPQTKPAVSATATTAVGTEKGAFSVDANGGATYTMDLDVPPGTHGVQPKLSIWYGSQNGEGLLGNGFTLQGLSSITRCQANLKLDGYNGGVGFNAADRFCLDGQRLVKISEGGDYGTAGSVYHTEQETWTRVTAVGTCGSGPCSFIATNKDGTTLELGTGDAGVALPGQSEIAAWQIKSSTDLNGNRVVVSYQLDPNTLQNVPAEIRYTENDAARIAATRKVTFEYESRAQTIPRYAGGHLFALDRRLKTIRTWLDGTEVLDYFLTYTTSAGTGRDLLASLQKCTAASQCYPATAFTYQTETNTLTSATGNSDAVVGKGWCTESNALTGWSDFNGDGLPDIHCDTSSGTHRVLLSNGKTLSSPNSNSDGTVKTGWCSGTGFIPAWVDFDGDGKSDLACDGSDGSHRVLLSNGKTLAPAGSSGDGLLKTGWCGNGSPQWGNFNADGRADLLCHGSDGLLRAMLSTGSGMKSPNSDAGGIVFNGTWCTSADAALLWGDFNGDQMSDAHCATRDGRQQVLVSNGATLASPNTNADGTAFQSSWCSGSSNQRGIADFNDDGLLDATCDSSDGKHWVLLSTGTLLVPPGSAADGLLKTSWCSGGTARWSDFNGDSFADLQCVDGSGNLMALLSTGTQLLAPATATDSVLQRNWCASSGATPDWIDFNADTLGDATCHASGTTQALVHTAGVPDLVSNITDGIGLTVDLTYAPLTDSTVYSVGTTSTYPTLEVRSPMYVVSRYVTGDGRGALYAFRYHYSGARTDLEEARWLGFEQVASTQEATGRQTVTTYRQEYPLLSFPASESLLDASGRTLASTTREPLIRNPYANVWEVLTASESTSTYTNGNADYTEVRSYTYDAYGDPTHIADVSSPYFEVHTCAKYQSSTDPWRIGYPLEQKTTRTSDACTAFLASTAATWNSATDLRWSRTAYDAKMNVTAESAWDDGNNAFLSIVRTYNAAGGVLSRTDAAGNVTTYTWDDTLTYPLTQVSPALSDGRHLTTTYSFHRAFGVPATITDVNGNAVAIDVDGFGRQTAIRGPDPASATGDPAVTLRTFAYAQDSTGRYVETRQRQSWSDSNTANWFYSRRYHDGLWRTFLIRNRSARTGTDVLVETLFDSAGREWKRAVPHYSGTTAYSTVTSYDDLDRPVTITRPDGMYEKTEYLQGAMQVRTTDYGASTPRTTTDTNDPRGLNLRSVAPNGGVTTSTYDPIGQSLGIVHPTGRTISTTWDSLGRPVKNVDGDTGTTTWSYGTDGLLHSTTNGAGSAVTFAYDSFDRPTRRVLTPAGGSQQTYAFAYDDDAIANGLGNLTRVTGPDYVEDYAYSRYSLVSIEQLTIGGQVYTDKVDYDPALRPELRTFADGAQLRTTRFVDGTINALDLKENGGQFRNYATYTSYDALQQPETLLLGNGLRTDNTYASIPSGMARQLSMSVAKQSAPSTSLLTRAYGWDLLSELTSVNTTYAGATGSETYTYDTMGWLTKASGPYGERTYQYDLAGNITKQYGLNYQFATASDRLTGIDDGTAFTYDGAGNVSGKQSGGATWQYEHDAAGRLSEVMLNGLLVGSHLYDSDDSRIRRVDASGTVSLYLAADVDLLQSGNSTVITKYIEGITGPIAAVTSNYSPQSLASLLRRQEAAMSPGRFNTRSLRGLASWTAAVLRNAAMRAGTAAVSMTSLLIMSIGALFLIRRTPYVRRHPFFSSCVPFVIGGLLLLGATEAQADLGAGNGYPVTGTLYIHGDQVDSTILVTDANGDESGRVAYEPFGKIDQARSSGSNHFRPKFSTKERDDGSGLDYFGARYYDPEIGRFLEADPLSQFSSAYVYGGNNPASMIDPDGRWVVLAAIVVGAVLGAYFGAASMNHNNYNPAQWDWKSGRTLAGFFAGAAIGAASASIGIAIGAASPAAGIAAEIVLAGGENAAFTAMGGGSDKAVLESFAIGAATGAVLVGAASGLAAAMDRVATSGSRMARRAERAVLDDTGDEIPQTCASFPAGEEIVMADGSTRPLDSLHAGDHVATRASNGRRRQSEVVATVHRVSDRITRIATAGGTAIDATPNHPFFTSAQRWVAASELRAGMSLVDDRGKPVPIASVETTSLPHPVPVFNITVDETHTYYVSDARVLAENVKGPCLQEAFAKRKNWRPTWKSGTREYLRIKQAVEGGIRSEATGIVYPANLRILIGKRNPRYITGWAIDHIVPWKSLLRAIDRTEIEISRQAARDIYNHRGNLRLITMPENASHAHELPDADADAAAEALLAEHGYWKQTKK